MIVILDFGSQYSRLIARRIRECNVYCEILPHDTPWDQIAGHEPSGIVLSGGPASVYDEEAPQCDSQVISGVVPVLGICYGLQLIGQHYGGAVEPAEQREYGVAQLQVIEPDDVFSGLPESFPVWMSHGDRITRMPIGFRALARSTNSELAAIANGAGIIGLQFHPEVAHTPLGRQILANFVTEVCHAPATWTPRNFIDQAVEDIRRTVGSGRVICALSGGVDSTVVAVLLARAIGQQLSCVFVDTGLLRLNEAQQLRSMFEQVLAGSVIHVDASDRFLRRLEGIVDPEEKRRIIGAEFINVFTEEASKLGTIEFLAQGTLYPDVIESTSHDTSATASKIKTHHNVGGLPADLTFKLVEPLRYLFKDEVREVGLELGLPERVIRRQPFPGPGLAVRIIGEVTPERLRVLRLADAIVAEEIRRSSYYDQLWQSFAVLTPLQTVGVMGDNRTYSNVVAVRAVTSEDAMTADWARLPHDLLARISNRVVNEIAEVNRVVYDITSKPPATIEWE